MNDIRVKNPLAKAVAIMHGSKDIKKNREALIRHLYAVNRIPQKSRADCAKCRTIELLSGGDANNFLFASDRIQPPLFIGECLSMSDDQWHDMERFFEGYLPFERGHSFAETADWLQTLPGWPRVL